MTAPDMESIIAEVLWNTDRTTHVPWNTLAEDDEDKGCYLEDARAVLAAISEAGTVEWGVEVQFDDGPEITPLKSRKLADHHKRFLTQETRVVSRITFPWERAE